MATASPAWALEMAWASDDDEHLPSAIDGINLVLNRLRLANFLGRFAEDKDVRDLLTLDVLGTTAGLPLSSTGLVETAPSLVMRPFRLWEYVWLYKSLALAARGARVLDLGGPASHLSVLAALAGCHVTSVDINPNFVAAAQECARALNLSSFDPRVGDMRDLSAFSGGSFDAVVCCSVLEHLTAHDQEIALREAARVLKPGGLIGLTFDLGIGAPGGNEHLPPPHDPAPTSAEALRRYLQGGLVLAGNSFSEDPIPGSLFRHESIRYTVASRFLAKPPVPDIPIPQSEPAAASTARLVIRELPYRLYRHVISVTALLNDLQIATEGLQNVPAGPQLAALQQKEQALAQLHAEIGTRDAALNDMRNQLERAVAIINEQHQRAITQQQAIADAEERKQQLESNLDALTAEKSALRQRVRGAEETLLGYLVRRVRRAVAGSL